MIVTRRWRSGIGSSEQTIQDYVAELCHEHNIFTDRVVGNPLGVFLKGISPRSRLDEHLGVSDTKKCPRLMPIGAARRHKKTVINV